MVGCQNFVHPPNKAVRFASGICENDRNKCEIDRSDFGKLRAKRETGSARETPVNVRHSLGQAEHVVDYRVADVAVKLF